MKKIKAGPRHPIDWNNAIRGRGVDDLIQFNELCRRLRYALSCDVANWLLRLYPDFYEDMCLAWEPHDDDTYFKQTQDEDYHRSDESDLPILTWYLDKAREDGTKRMFVAALATVCRNGIETLWLSDGVSDAFDDDDAHSEHRKAPQDEQDTGNAKATEGNGTG